MNYVDKKIYFHESTLQGFKQSDDELSIAIEDASDEKGNKIKCHLIIKGNIKIKIDEQIVQKAEEEFADGEILNLIIEKKLEMLVEWNDFKNKKSRTKFYEVIGDNINIVITD